LLNADQEKQQRNNFWSVFGVQ